MIKVFDYLSQEAVDLHYSLESSGFKGLSLVLNDEGNLPEGFTSPYAYFCQMGDQETSPLYFNQIKVPDFWQITGTNTQGEIWNFSQKKATISYHTPNHLRLVKTVEWLDKDGKVYLIDHYNQFGWIFARTSCSTGSARTKTYYNQAGQVVLSENMITGDVLLNWQGKTYQFAKRNDFYLFYMRLVKFDQEQLFYNSLSTPFVLSYYLGGEKDDLLFWQEPIVDQVPGNMKLILSGRAGRTKHVMVQDKAAYQKLRELLSPEELARVSYLGYISPVKKDNQSSKQILILTNSDQLEGLEQLRSELVDYHFHIAALTEMSTRLTDFGDFDNVTLYPNIAPHEAERLFEQCDIYLDINYGSEILSATRQAFESNLLLMTFDNIAHNRQLTLSKFIFQPDCVQEMVFCLRAYPDLQELIEAQRHGAGQESVANYQTIVGKWV